MWLAFEMVQPPAIGEKVDASICSRTLPLALCVAMLQPMKHPVINVAAMPVQRPQPARFCRHPTIQAGARARPARGLSLPAFGPF